MPWIFCEILIGNWVGQFVAGACVITHVFSLYIYLYVITLHILTHVSYHSAVPKDIIHHNDVIMSAMASQITSLKIVYSTVYSTVYADQRKHQSSASMAFVQGIHRWPVILLHKGPVTRKIFPFDDVIMSPIGATLQENEHLISSTIIFHWVFPHTVSFPSMFKEDMIFLTWPFTHRTLSKRYQVLWFYAGVVRNQRPASMRGIHLYLVDSPHKG